jgi:glycerol-3-phosphate acyltransferase PlsY
VWIAVFLLLRYASVASIVAAASLPVWAAVLGYSWPVIAFGGVAAAAVALLHRANIKRLLAGTENRFRLRRTAPGEPSSGRSL